MQYDSKKCTLTILRKYAIMQRNHALVLVKGSNALEIYKMQVYNQNCMVRTNAIC